MHTTSPGQPPTEAVPRRGWSAWIVGTVCAAALVVALLGWAVAARWAPVLRLDTAVSGALYAGDDRSRLVDTGLRVATAPGGWAVRTAIAVPLLVWLARRRAWWTAAWALAAIALVGLLSTGLKHLVGRQRPQFAEGGATYQSLSYPSGHASGIATLVTVGLVLAWPLLEPPARRLWLAGGVVVTVLVGFSRMWLGVHFLSDVVGGWALGVGWTVLTAAAFGALPGGRAALRRRQ